MHDGYHRGWDRDGDRGGDRGWHRGGDWHRGGGWHHDGGWHHGHRYGRPGFGPGSIERMVDRLARAADASSEQRDKMNAIAQRAGGQLMALREKHLAARQQVREILAAPTIDRAKLESLRAEQMKLADEASRHITAALADVAEVLSPAQRADLARRMERRMGRRP